MREHSKAVRESAIPDVENGRPSATVLSLETRRPLSQPAASTPVSRTEKLLEELLTHLRSSPTSHRGGVDVLAVSRESVHRSDTRTAEDRRSQSMNRVEDNDARLRFQQPIVQQSAPPVHHPVATTAPEQEAMYEPPHHPQLSQNPDFSASRFAASPRGPVLHAPSRAPSPVPSIAPATSPLRQEFSGERLQSSLPAGILRTSPLRQEFSGRPSLSKPPAQQAFVPQRVSLVTGASSVAGDSDAQSLQDVAQRVPPPQDDAALPFVVHRSGGAPGGS